MGRAGRADPRRDRRRRPFYAGLAEGLIAYAESTFELTRQVDDGAGGKCAYRVQIEALAAGGDSEAIAILANAPTIPPLAAYLWTWWVDLASTRTNSGFGPNPITRHDIHAWEADTFHRLNGWERATILKLDALWLASVQAQTDKETK